MALDGIVTGTTDGVYDDGDWTVEAASGLPLHEYPFQSRGDTKTYILRQRFQVARDSYQPIAANTPHPTYTSALFIEEGPHRDLGGGKIEYERAFATIPLHREEPEAFAYEFQTVFNGATQPLILPVSSTVQYDYFLSGSEGEFPLSYAPKLIPVAGALRKIGTGNLSSQGNCVISSDETILAENDTYDDWKGEIRFRKRRLIPGPTLDFWGSVFNV